MVFPSEHFLLHIADSDSGDTFIPLGGLQIRSMQLRANPLDSPTGGSGWRQFAAQSAAVRMQIDGSGVFTAAASDHLLAHLFLAHSQVICRLTMPDFGVFTGPFLIVELAYEARRDDEVQWRIGLHSAADILFTPDDADGASILQDRQTA